MYVKTRVAKKIIFPLHSGITRLQPIQENFCVRIVSERMPCT